MTRNVELRLDDFGQHALDRLVAGLAGSRGNAFQTAARYYFADRGSGRPSWCVPKFRGRASARPRLGVEFDDDTWAELEAEARRQGVRTEELAVHSLLYLLADFESGRLEGLLDERLRLSE